MSLRLAFRSVQNTATTVFRNVSRPRADHRCVTIRGTVALNAGFMIRPASSKDLEVFTGIQKQCYPNDFLESPKAFLAKLTSSPGTSFIALSTDPSSYDKPLGYMVAVPSTLASFPELDSQTYTVPEKPTIAYLHDLSVLPSARKFGIGTALMRHAALFFETERGLPEQFCVSVQGSSKTLLDMGLGFEIVDPKTYGMEKKLATYGSGALLLRRMGSLPKAKL